MKIYDQAARFCSRLTDSLASIVKVILLSRPVKRRTPRRGEIVILGNGPALRETLDNSLNALTAIDRTAVNFAANAPEYRSLRPTGYILIDPHFFRTDGADGNVEKLWENLAATDWEMTLTVPVKMVARSRERLKDSKVNVRGINITPAEGFAPVRNFIYSRGLGMPRPRNVLIPAIMDAIADGYDTIYIAGADHSWTRTLAVDDQNRVVSIQPHFYKDGEKELKRVSSEYRGYHLHDILRSLYIAFRAYFDIAEYAQRKHVKIINITPGSFIDAFPRGSLPAKS